MQKKIRRKALKFPNGFGSIIFLGESRRKPYGAVKTLGYDENGKQISIGKMSESNYKSLMSAYKVHLSKLRDINIMNIRKKDIQDIINNCNGRHTTRGYIKNIFERIIKFAIEELELPINTNIYDLDIGKKEKSDKHFPFKSEEIIEIKNIASQHINNYNNLQAIDTFILMAKLIVVYLYTGLRPSELLDIENINVFLNEDYMRGGEKTEAGRNRIIPIHHEIKPFIEEWYNSSNKYLINYNGKKMSYDRYKKLFDKLMTSLNIDHTPYDTRHTFSTKLWEIGTSDTDIKVLMGHSLANDVTNNVYIHRTINHLNEVINKLNY